MRRGWCLYEGQLSLAPLHNPDAFTSLFNTITRIVRFGLGTHAGKGSVMLSALFHLAPPRADMCVGSRWAFRMRCGIGKLPILSPKEA
jgi:hypothetical protein